jgi:hypothetical protein
MRGDLQASLQERWEESLGERARISPRSIVPALDALLATDTAARDKIRSLSRSAPISLPKRTSERRSAAAWTDFRSLTC